MTENYSFSLKQNNITNSKFIKYEFEPGINVIYGESGVGKSGLINRLANQSTQNKQRFSIQNISIKQNVQIILQNPDQQIVSNSIKNELVFNLECNSNDSIQIKKQLDNIFEYLLFKVDLNRHPVTLSGGEKELLNIATTLSLNPKVILIDDALSFLSDKMKRNVINQFNKYKNTIILWFTSDIRDFQFGGSYWTMTYDRINKLYKIPEFESLKYKLEKGKLNLSISNLNFSYSSTEPIFNNYNTSIEDFRCLGVTGNNGSGKSTLASLLLKIDQPNFGSIKLKLLENENIDIGFLDQFPEKLLGIMTIKEFVQQLINFKKLDINNINNIESDLETNNINWKVVSTKSALELSWTKLRITLICILANSKYELLILDEPTFGMGHQQKLKLTTYFIRYLSKKHLILISHDKIFINSLCDSIIKL